MNEAAARWLERGHVPVIGMNAALPVLEKAHIEDRYKAVMAYFGGRNRRLRSVAAVGRKPRRQQGTRSGASQRTSGLLFVGGNPDGIGEQA